MIDYSNAFERHLINSLTMNAKKCLQIVWDYLMDAALALGNLYLKIDGSIRQTDITHFGFFKNQYLLVHKKKMSVFEKNLVTDGT